MHKRLRVVLGFAVLGAAGVLLWVAQPLPANPPAESSRPTANPNSISPASSTYQQPNLTEWQRFTNETYGYTLLYPPFLEPSTNPDLELSTSPVVYIGEWTIIALDPQTVHSSASAVAEAYSLPIEDYLDLLLSLNRDEEFFDIDGHPTSDFATLGSSHKTVRYARITPALTLPSTGRVPGSFLYAVAESPDLVNIQLLYRDDPNLFIGTAFSMLQTFQFLPAQ